MQERRELRPRSAYKTNNVRLEVRLGSNFGEVCLEVRRVSEGNNTRKTRGEQRAQQIPGSRGTSGWQRDGSTKEAFTRP